MPSVQKEEHASFKLGRGSFSSLFPNYAKTPGPRSESLIPTVSKYQIMSVSMVNPLDTLIQIV